MKQNKPSGVAAAQAVATDIAERLRNISGWSCDQDVVVVLCTDAAEEIERLRLAPDEREAVNAMACYFDTRGNLQMQAWGSLLHTLLLRMTL